MEIVTLGIDSAENKQRIWQQAADLNKNCQRLSWQLVQLAKLLLFLREPSLRQGGKSWIKGYLVDYRNANQTVGKPEINVAQPIDAKIPFNGKALADYLSIICLWSVGISFLKKEFGQRAVDDVGESLNHTAGFYKEAAEIFNQTQTTFNRGRQGGLKFKLLRFIDKSRNCAPSLHIELAGYAYSCLTDIIDEHAIDSPAKYQPMKQALFRQAVRIIESVLLVKQHTVMDVGLGLAALSGQESSFTQDRAYKMIDAMFQENKHGMDEDSVISIRRTIINIYNEVMAAINTRPGVTPTQILIEYLKNIQGRSEI